MGGVCRDWHKPRASGSNRPYVTRGIRHVVQHVIIVEQNVALIVDTAAPLDRISDENMQFISGNSVVRDGGVGDGNGIFCVHVNP